MDTPKTRVLAVILTSTAFLTAQEPPLELAGSVPRERMVFTDLEAVAVDGAVQENLVGN